MPHAGSHWRWLYASFARRRRRALPDRGNGEEQTMQIKKRLCVSVAAIAVAAFLAGSPAQLVAQQGAPVSIGNADLGGVVTGPKGPEAGVWVIAETTELPTKMAKMVVTDDQGRYVLPDLPKAN